MLGIDKDVVRISHQKSTAERLEGLKRIIPCRVIKSILKQTGQTQSCKRLPKEFMVRFVIGMGLFATEPYRQIVRWLQPASKDITAGGVPQRSTLCEARQRLSVAPLYWLVQKVVRLLAQAMTPGAFYRGRRLMAIDGFVVDLFDNEANARVFGRPKGGRTNGAFPQARVVALCEVGTHVLWKSLIKPIRCAEIVVARTLLGYLQPDMLLLWDRGFLSFANVAAVVARQANLLARIKKNLVFSRLRSLDDGSYLAKIYPCSRDRRKDRNGRIVRIIEYRIDDPTRDTSSLPGRHRPRVKDTTPHRLLTTLLDADEHPATTLVELYHERWEQELAIDELKTHQQTRPVLRSQTPAGVVQELYGMMLAHFVIRTLMFEAAALKQLPPRRISFTGTLKILRCRLPECPRDRAGQTHWYDKLCAEIAEEILPPRRNRINPRVIKRKMSKWAKKQPRDFDQPQPTKPFRETIVIAR